MKDAIALVGALLDAVKAQGGGRVQRFQFLPWGHHQDQDRWSALPLAGQGPAPVTTVGDSAFSIRQVSNVARTADVGGGAAIGRQVMDVMLWWQDGEDVLDPDAFRDAVTRAVAAIVRANEKAVAGFTFVAVVNSINGDFLEAAAGTGSHRHLQVVTVEAFWDDVYGS